MELGIEKAEHRAKSLVMLDKVKAKAKEFMENGSLVRLQYKNGTVVYTKNPERIKEYLNNNYYVLQSES